MFNEEELAVIADCTKAELKLLEQFEDFGIPCTNQIAKTMMIRAKALQLHANAVKARQANEALAQKKIELDKEKGAKKGK